MHKMITLAQNLLFFNCLQIQQQNKMHYHTLILFLLAAVLCQGFPSTNGTDSYFLSPRALASTTEVDDALKKITGDLRIKKTTYNHSSIAYIMDNFTFTTAYNRDQQIFEIDRLDSVKFTGGRILFTYRFSYIRVDFDSQTNITGYAEGSVLSDPLTYTKQKYFCKGFLCWKLAKDQEDLTLIENRMKINKMQPFLQADLENMEDMLDKVFMAINPANIQIQLLEIFNYIFPSALQNELNKEVVLDESISYTFLSSTHGEMKMNIFHHLYYFAVKPNRGQNMVFVSSIEGWDKPICDEQTVPYYAYSFEFYGDKQDFHLNCYYQSVVEYLQSKGWLDTVVDSKWESDGYKLNAGNHFEFVNNLVLTFSPEAQLEGSCTALKEGLRIQPSLDGTNIYNLDIPYECSLSGISKEGQKSEMLKFQTSVRLFIQAGAAESTLTFQIVDAHANHLKFEHVNNYFVSNIGLAMVKVNAALKSLKNTFTFGTGFPTLTRKMPKTIVEENFVLYYEGSHGEVEALKQ